MSLPIYTIFENPKDFPGKFVCRLFLNDQPTDQVQAFDTLKEARALPISLGLYRMIRHPSDDAVIVESWV